MKVLPMPPSPEMKITKLSSTDFELWSLPALGDQLPIRFDNGSIWHGFTVKCFNCSEPIGESCLRGRISRPVTSISIIEARGYCKHCSALTRVHLRVTDQKQISLYHNGRWIHRSAKTNFLNALWRFIRKYRPCK